MASSSLDDQVPVIDLSEVSSSSSSSLRDESRHDGIVKSIAKACSTFGFFQVTSHSISPDLLASFQDACRELFTDLDMQQKYELKRSEHNSRGFFDDELTKQRVDWKQCLDAGVPGSRDWSLTDNDPQNQCLDGCNQFPSSKILPNFRKVFVDYFEACWKLSHRIAVLMAEGLGEDETNEFIQSLKAKHTSYLRVNYYPPCDSTDHPPPLGISPHRDAGFLTVLLQDDDCHSLQVLYRDEWHLVKPVPGAVTINTGDMAQIWSNGIYQAPLHRVLTNTSKKRYSAPFFYNPGYDAWVAPLKLPTTTVISTTRAENNGIITTEEELNNNVLKYHPVLWGYYRAIRFAGDLTDLGVEIQIEDFEISSNDKSKHVEKQKLFAEKIEFQEAFSVERYKSLMLQD